MICISISNKKIQEILDLLEQTECAEIRLDLLDLTESEINKIFSSHGNLIATCRSKSTEKIPKLINAIEAGASYVDIELEFQGKEEMIKLSKEKNCKVIISYHNKDITPSKKELEKIIEESYVQGADLVKIACQINDIRDNIRLLSLLENSKKLIVIGMGEKGKISRIAAPLLGSVLTFASTDSGNETAEGQMTVGEMREIYKILGVKT